MLLLHNNNNNKAIAIMSFSTQDTQDAEKGEMQEVFPDHDNSHQPYTESSRGRASVQVATPPEGSYNGKRFLAQKAPNGTLSAAHQRLGRTRTFFMDFNVYR